MPSGRAELRGGLTALPAVREVLSPGRRVSEEVSAGAEILFNKEVAVMGSGAALEELRVARAEIGLARARRGPDPAAVRP